MTETPDLAAIQARADAATEGREWHSGGSVLFTGPEREGHPAMFCGTQHIAQRIAELHNAVLRDVTARAEAAEATVARIEAQQDLLKRAIITLLPSLRLHQFVDRWAEGSPGSRALQVLADYADAYRAALSAAPSGEQR